MQALCLLFVITPFVLGQNPANMNPGLKYTIANPRAGFEGKTFPFIGKYFEVKSPTLRMQYSEVFWDTLPAVPLPAEIISRYQNSTIAITGFEVDVLRINNVTGKEESVPAYHSYNHHYSPNIISSAVSLKLDRYGRPMGHDHGHGKVLEFELRNGASASPPNARLNQAFVHGNGQEHRQIYHGLPAGYVQSIYSPHSFILTPMQINTNDGTGKKGASGPLPQISRETVPPNTPYSPLLECPCTTRMVKKIGRVTSLVEGQCPQPFLHSDCFVGAAKALGYAAIQSNTSTSSPTLPSGCVVSRVSEGKNLFNVVFNTNSQSTILCQGTGKPDPTKNRLLAYQESLITISLDVDGVQNIVTISLSGPSQFWFGVGFNASQMADLPYAIIVDGDGQVHERKLANHDPGTVLQPSLKLLNATVTNGVRTVVLQRALQGLTSDHYSFSPSVATINFINALGSTVTITHHKDRAASTLDLFHADLTPSCLCTDSTGSIDGIPYTADCKPEPLSDLLEQNNPTCQVSSYVGGLACCVHKTLLLDADQTPPPFVDEVYFKFRFYYEDYNPNVHQDIHHVEWSLNGCDSGAGGPNPFACRHIEFDIVKGVGSSAGSDIQMLSSTFPAKGMLETSCSPTLGQCMDLSKVGPGGIKLILAAAHCHAPNCLRQELINMDTNELLCAAVPVHGTSAAVFDEEGYLFSPPCTWGSATEGFQQPPVLYMNNTLRMVTYYNSTYGHPGQMGIWQMKAAYNV